MNISLPEDPTLHNAIVLGRVYPNPGYFPDVKNLNENKTENLSVYKQPENLEEFGIEFRNLEEPEGT